MDPRDETIKLWLIARGWVGVHTGKTIRFPVHDGYAIYMLADSQTPALMHLAYGEPYGCPAAALIAYKDVLQLIDEQRRADAALFAPPKSVAA